MPVEKQKIRYEFVEKHRQCDAKDVSASDGRCERIVTHWVQLVGYTGRVYCRRHSSLARKKNT